MTRSPAHSANAEDGTKVEPAASADEPFDTGPLAVTSPYSTDSDIADDERLLVDVGGYEGPLDMLLALARDQKVDLAKISILALAEQYLVFIADARRVRLELAADYLVMAAWLAYLKSRLLLPDTDDDEEPSGDELAAALAFRLRRLEAMREAATRIMNRNRLGRDIFPRGQTEPVVISRTAQFQAGLYDMLEAYSAMRSRSFVRHVRFERRRTMTLQEARDRLLRLVGPIAGSQYNWSSIDAFIAEFVSDPEMRATAMASSLTASLELVREGTMDVRQSSPFAPIFVRRREPTSGEPSSDRKDMPADA